MNQDLLEAFRRCRGNARIDEGRMAVLVAQLLDPDIVRATVEARLQSLAAECPVDTAPWEFLAGRGFEGNVADYQSLDNSNLGRVLETGRGIPISLGVVLMRVARAAGRAAAGINFPGHFLVQVDDALVDPFVMRTIEPEDLLKRHAAAAQTSPEALFAVASPLAVGLRMLNNVKLIYSGQAAWHKTLDVLDAQLALAPQQPALHLEQGDVWRRLGSVTAARASWERVLELAAALTAHEAKPMLQAVRVRLAELDGSGDVLH